MNLPSLANLHLNCYHHSTVLWILSITAGSWLFLSILNYLSDSCINHTGEKRLWFLFCFILFLSLTSGFCLASVAAWLWCRGNSDVWFWPHLSPNLLIFSFLSPYLHFSSLLIYKLTYLRLCSFLAWLVAAFPALEFPLQHHAPHLAPAPHHPPRPFSTPLSLFPSLFPLSFARRTRMTLLSVPYLFREPLVFPGVGLRGDSPWPKLPRVGGQWVSEEWNKRPSPSVGRVFPSKL